MAVGEDPLESPGESPGEFKLAGGGVEAGGDAAGDEPGELGELVGAGGTEVDEDASLIIVNSGLALPESPNRTTI